VSARRRAVIAACVAVAVVSAGAAAALLMADRPAVPEEQRPGGFTPAQSTEEPTHSAVPTYTGPVVLGAEETPPAGAPTDGAQPTRPGAADPQRAPVVAYRRDGWLCVTSETEPAEKRLVRSSAGPFALSPDGATLAWIDEASGRLLLIDTARGESATVGPAVPSAPSWASDSEAVVYTAPGPVVRRVLRDGTGAQTLFEGQEGVFASRGGSVVGISAGGASEIVVWREGGRVARIDVGAPVTSVAADDARVYYATRSVGTARARLGSIARDGTDPRDLVHSSASAKPVMVTDLRLSPDGRILAYAERGDDGYARVFTVRLDGGAPVPLPGRRDCLLLDWGADGQSLLVIEGNAVQSEVTSLVRVRPDGTARVVLKEGAGL